MNLELDITRTLSPESVFLGKLPASTKTLKKLTSRHHYAARMLATGGTARDVVAATGLSPQRVYMLQKDPAFSELQAYYAKHVEAKFDSVLEKLKMLSEGSLDILLDRIEEEAEDFTTQELLAISEAGLDRTGFAKTAIIENKNSGLSDMLKAKLEAEKQGAVIIAKGDIIDGEYTESDEAKPSKKKSEESSKTKKGTGV